MAESEFLSWIIDIRLPKLNKSFRIRLDNRLIVGRTDHTNETNAPDVDLSTYQAEDQGVSRQHLKLHVEDDQLVITDLNSGNGTFLNGKQLEPNKPYPIKHDDALKLGNLETTIGIIISPSYGSSVHKQTSLQLKDQVEPGDGQLILVVEDDPAVAKLLSMMLSRAGYTTMVSYDVIGAMRIFKQRKPSAVVLDIMLPHMNGLELCRFIRRDTEQNMTPVIAISALKSQERIDEAMAAGADIFLGKPLSSKELRHVVGSLISNYEKGVASLNTKHLVGTAPLRAEPPESRRDSAVLFIAGYNDDPITVRLNQPVSLGRKSNTKGRNHIDLSRYKAVDLGVSREHAVLRLEEDTYFVRDLGSVNGTFLNGEPVKSGTEITLSNADEIRLGQLRMYIYFLIDEEREMAAAEGAK